MTDAFVPPAGRPGPAVTPAGSVPVRVRRKSPFAELAPPRWFPLAAAGAGLVTAALVVDHAPGVGLTLSCAAVAAAGLPAIRVARADRPLLAVAAGLALMPALRDAGWLVALDLLALLALACLVAVGVRDWRSVVVAAVSVPLRSLRAPAFLARGLPRTGELGPAVRGTALGAALVLAFGALFASADAAFGSLVGRLSPDLGLLPVHLFVFAVVTLGLGGGVLAHRVPVTLPPTAERRPARGAEWVVPLVALDALFAVFVLVQLAVLFGGQEHVLRTAGLTYAEYARSGFFQLIAVTALTLGVVAGAARWAPATRGARALVGVLLGLDGIVLLSAVRRLALYEQAFGLSIDRIVAHTVALWLGVVLVLVVVAGVTRRSSWLPRAVVTTGAAALLLLNVVNPDALVARSQVERYERTGTLDTEYLAGLSADAAPELARLPAAIRPCVDVDDGGWPSADGWPSANLARSRARALATPC